MYCNKCGSSNEPDAMVCKKCGSKDLKAFSVTAPVDQEMVDTIMSSGGLVGYTVVNGEITKTKRNRAITLSGIFSAIAFLLILCSFLNNSTYQFIGLFYDRHPSLVVIRGIACLLICIFGLVFPRRKPVLIMIAATILLFVGPMFWAAWWGIFVYPHSPTILFLFYLLYGVLDIVAVQALIIGIILNAKGRMVAVVLLGIEIIIDIVCVLLALFTVLFSKNVEKIDPFDPVLLSLLIPAFISASLFLLAYGFYTEKVQEMNQKQKKKETTRHE